MQETQVYSKLYGAKKVWHPNGPFEQWCQKAGIPAGDRKRQLAIRNKITRELYENESEDVKDEVKKYQDDIFRKAMDEWESLQGLPSGKHESQGSRQQ